MKKILLPIFLSIALALTAEYCAQKTIAVPQQFNYKVDLIKVRTSPQKVKGIDSLLQSFVDQKKVSSAVGFVAKGGDVVYEKVFGWMDVEKEVPATPDACRRCNRTQWLN